MKIKSIFFHTVGSVTVMSATATAALTLTFTSTVSLTDGIDPFGFDGSTWTFRYNSSHDEYVNIFVEPGVIMNSASLTVSGAGDSAYNGTFSIVDRNTTNFASIPNGGNSMLFLGLNTNGGPGSFNFGPGPVIVYDPILYGAALSEPMTGDPIQLSDFQGAMLSGGFYVNSGSFTLANSTLNASVPEPATYPALFGLVSLALTSLRHLRRPSV